MKTIVALILVAAVLSSSLSACAGKTRPFVELAGLLPSDATGVVYLDIGTMANDPDLANFNSSLQSEMTGIEEDYGIAISSAKALVMAYFKDSALIIFKGDFNLEKIRSALTNNKSEGFTQEKYRNVELWKGTDYSIALPKGMFVLGNSPDKIHGLIELNQGEGTSWYENEQVKSVVERLPEGLNMMMSVGSMVRMVQYAAGGVSFTKSTNADSTMSIKGCYRFKNADDAAKSLTGLEDYIKSAFDASSVDIKVDGEFIEVTGEAKLDLTDIFF